MTGQHAGDGLGPADLTTPIAHVPAADVAVQVAGRDTVTFAAIRAGKDTCTCGTSLCPDAPATIPAPAGPVLSYGPGVVSRMWRTRVRNGEWADIRAEVREARKRVQDEADKRQEQIHNDLDCDWHDIAAVFRADTTALTDPELAEGLRRLEAGLAEGLAGMRRAAAEREAELIETGRGLAA